MGARHRGLYKRGVNQSSKSHTRVIQMDNACHVHGKQRQKINENGPKSNKKKTKQKQKTPLLACCTFLWLPGTCGGVPVLYVCTAWTTGPHVLPGMISSFRRPGCALKIHIRRRRGTGWIHVWPFGCCRGRVYIHMHMNVVNSTGGSNRLLHAHYFWSR
jgi:hypothetical protein